VAKSRIVLVRDRGVIDDQGQIRPVTLGNMLDGAVSALLDKRDPSSAWKSLVSPGDVVGIKTNVWRYLPTPEPLAMIIQAKRQFHFGEDRQISPNPRHIVLAGSRYGLGRSRPEEIEIVRLGWNEDSLV
jgi:hypothetical protein